MVVNHNQLNASSPDHFYNGARSDGVSADVISNDGRDGKDDSVYQLRADKRPRRRIRRSAWFCDAARITNLVNKALPCSAVIVPQRISPDVKGCREISL